jgi:nucleotide-binding universal stress UspA family protein
VFKHLLVPLDGSRLAESVLPAVASLAETCGAWVTLVHVIEKKAPPEVHGEPHLQDPEAAERYLAEIAGRSLPHVQRIERHVHTGEVRDIAAGIVQHIKEFATDLTVMCAHGRGGVRDWLFGNIAQQVINLAASPVLVIKASGAGPAKAFYCRRLLVPLDGDAAHEQGLARAADLARAYRAAMHLITVVPTQETLSGRARQPSRLLPATTSHLLDMSVPKAEAYLKSKQVALAGSGLETTIEVARGRPESVIALAAQHPSIDLVVLATHGKTGVTAFWSGSLGARVCRACRRPLLLIPVSRTS